DNLGWVWTFDRDAAWAREPGTFHNRPARAVWAPEISHFNGQYWLTYSVNHTTPKHSFGIGILHADQPEGPWQEVSPDHPVSEGYDPSLFRDDDGAVYLVRNRCLLTRLKDDLSGLAGPGRTLAPTNFPAVGFEGPCLFKYRGRYYLAAAETLLHADGKASYDCVVAAADHVEGPYGPRYVAIRYGGHNGFFVDKDGQLRATVWRLPGEDLQITFPHIELSPEGLLRPVLADCLPPDSH
ncbi:family 43 glycosylhydrolase, partial [Jatrophihabitans endophyticus]|uniref:family 43 glycosylhydrolase n=1 Tax=Jatrophihabitans endophyticus TaxID=1206085 RepID=UPI001A0545A3